MGPLTHDSSASAPRRTLTLFVVVLVLLALYGIQSWAGSRTPPPPENPLSNLDVSSITQMQLRTGEAFITLLKGVDGWSIADADDRADGEAIERFLNDVQSAPVLRLASEHVTDLEPFGLDSAVGIEVMLTPGEGDPIAFALSGRPRSASTFLQPRPGTAVYEIRWGYTEVPLSTDAWRSRTVYAAESAGVTEIELRGADGFSLRRNGSQFLLSRNGVDSDADPEKAQSYLLRIAGLRATGFIPPEEAKLDPPASTLVVRRQNLPDFELKIGAATETGDRAAKSNERKVIFGLTASDVDALTKPDLLPSAPASLAPASSAEEG